MRLTIISHKECVPDTVNRDCYLTDGGFPLQVQAISELFTETRLLVPCLSAGGADGMSRIECRNLSIVELAKLEGRDWSRKLMFPYWLIRNGRVIWKEVRAADAIHTPIPGDVGTIGMIFALLLRKPLFVRHCGNWMVQTTTAERFWKWCMERFAGGKNVMLATGGGDRSPSVKNPAIRWIFSTSLSAKQLESVAPRVLPVSGPLRLVIACRQENKKGTDVVLQSLPKIIEMFPTVVLDVVGGGSRLPALRELAVTLGIEDRVTFHGKVSQTQVLSVLSKSHIFCYPTSASEGFPKVVLEALANGLPVVTTRVSVLPHLLSNGCGVLIEPDAGQLAEAVIEISRDEATYGRMSLAAVDVAKQFTLEKWRDSIGESLEAAWSPDFRSARRPVLDRSRSSV